MELSIPCEQCFSEEKQPLQIFGFPLHKGNYHALDMWGKKIELVQYGMARENRVKLYSPSEHRIGYAISTLPGHSGSPIVSSERIIGIHTGGGNEDE
jgi:V8-like Glu-specific endopeptidase